MRDEHEGDPQALLQALELGLHLLAKLQVERPERLVEQQDLRLINERACEGDALLLAARELRRSAIGERFELDEVEHLERPLAPFRGGNPPYAEPISNVVRDVHVRKERVVLEHGIDVALEGRNVGDVDTVEQHLPAVRVIEARDQPQTGRLAGAGRAQKREKLARRDRERDAVEGDDRAEGPGRLTQFDRRRGRSPFPLIRHRTFASQAEKGERPPFRC